MFCSRTQHGLTRVGLEPQTSGSGVQGINHPATAPPLLSICASIFVLNVSKKNGQNILYSYYLPHSQYFRYVHNVKPVHYASCMDIMYTYFANINCMVYDP